MLTSAEVLDPQWITFLPCHEPQLQPKPRLSTLEITPAQVAAAATSQKGSPSERPKLLRRPSGHDSSRVAIDAMKNASTGPRTAKDREEEYNKARERIIGAVDAANGLGRGMGRAGMAAGRGMPGLPSPNNPGFAAANGRGRGRKGAFKDRALEDPDYVRGLNRCGGDTAWLEQLLPQGCVESSARFDSWL